MFILHKKLNLKAKIKIFALSSKILCKETLVDDRLDRHMHCLKKK
jgi:hypothetical protein